MKQYTPYEWLLINVANLAGHDKLSWGKRIQWTSDNYNQLESLIEEASKPYQYSEAVKDLRKVEQGEEVTLPIFLDATASGISIMAILRHDRKTAFATNVINNGVRNDPYSIFATQFGITRQEAKDALMPYFYSSIATPLSIIGKERFGEFLNKIEIEYPGPCLVLSTMESLHREDVDYVHWIAPDGHECHVKYWKPVDKSIETVSFGKFTYRIYTQSPTDNYRSLAANFIQSLDAYICREMVRMSHEQGFEIMTIHDSFGCLPSHVDKMRKNYLLVLQKLAQWNPEKALDSISGNKGHWRRFQDKSFIDDILTAEYALS